MLRSLFTLVAASALLVRPAVAQDTGQTKAKGAAKEVSMTGCLSKGAGGEYVLTNEKTGRETTVTGTADLEKHSANHKVKLTGTRTTEGGKTVLNVSKIDHISDTCTPAAGKSTTKSSKH